MNALQWTDYAEGIASQTTKTNHPKTAMWILDAELENKERQIEYLQKQYDAAKSRMDVLDKELRSHKRQVASLIRNNRRNLV